MYPFIRALKEFVVHRNAPKIGVTGTHVSYHRCWPHDLDWFLEMNNGRILTILDLGRNLLAKRAGLLAAMRANGWGLAMAGVSVRYRKRIRPFVRFRVESKTVGWDDRFMYLVQSIWIGDTCAAQALYRSAITDKNGIVPPARFLDFIGDLAERPQMPDWVVAWIDAEALRPWQPQSEAA